MHLKVHSNVKYMQLGDSIAEYVSVDGHCAKLGNYFDWENFDSTAITGAEGLNKVQKIRELAIGCAGTWNALVNNARSGKSYVVIPELLTQNLKFTFVVNESTSNINGPKPATAAWASYNFKFAYILQEN